MKHASLLLLGLHLLFPMARAAEDGEKPAALVEHVTAHPSGEAAFSLDKTAWQGDTRALPIGVFDSGIGGLTVLEAILKLDTFHNDTLRPGADGLPDFQNERFVYFGDQANMPYGNYPAAGKTDYLRELILKDAVFLLGRRFHPKAGEPPVLTKPPVKAIVIACNTATAYGLDDIRAALKTWGIPVFVVGVVEAGARGVLENRPDQDGAVAVLATAGTCASGAYPRAITGALGLAGRKIPEIVQRGSTDLAGVIEGNPAFPGTSAETALRDVRTLLETHRKSGDPRPIDTVVLGCTHFPLVKTEIEAAFTALHEEPEFRGITSRPRLYVDPADCAARELFRALASAKLRLRDGEPCVIPQDLFFLSVPNPQCPGLRLTSEGALDAVYKYQRSPGKTDREETVNIPLTAGTLPASAAGLVREKLPLVSSRLGP